MWQIYYSSQASKFIKRLSGETKERIKLAIESLQINHDLGKQLTGSLKGLRSLRVGNYRVIYKKELDELIILIVAVGHRKNVYRG
ncbi:MAG: type II toxin-antitoxin system RelE/ParE family toxin [Ignavibacteriales bacterium]|nr:type II toxin-antitoxin system RelE/ParE family toxin [Ignavibacteriales bacterium]